MTGVWASSRVAGVPSMCAPVIVFALWHGQHIDWIGPAQHTLAIVRAHRRVGVADRRLARAPDAGRIGLEPGTAARPSLRAGIPAPRAARLGGAAWPIAAAVAAAHGIQMFGMGLL